MTTPGYYPIKGGTETVVKNLSIELNRVGVHVDVMTFNMDRKWHPKWKGKTERIYGIKTFKIPALNWLPIGHSSRINLGVNLIPGRFTNILKEYDILHFHEEFSFPVFSSLVRKPKIFHLHMFDVNFFKRYRLNRIILKHVADFYVSISRRMQRDLLGLGIRRDKIVHLPNGIDTKVFRPQREREDNLLLFIGRIDVRKGLHILLESLRYLEKPIRLVIVGPPSWNLEYYQNILSLIEKENRKRKHKIEYLGTIDSQRLLMLYQESSILILPSFAEGLPVVILEGLSCETPVIATPVGGVPEVVRNGENGILVPRNNPLKLAEAIQYLLDNKDIRIRLGLEGRKWIMENFSLEVVVNKLCKIYRNLSVVD